MPEYLSPAVYMEEISSGIKPIEGVGTSTGAFVGFAQRGPVNSPVLITNFSQFQRTFGPHRSHFALAYGVQHFFQEGGTRCYVTRAFKPSDDPTPDNPSPDSAAVILPAGDTDALRVFAKSAGKWGNKISVSIQDASFHPDDEEGTTFKLVVKFQESPDEEPDIVESYDRLSMAEFREEDFPNPLHVEAQINDVSSYIQVQDLSTDPEQTAPPDNVADQSLTGGSDGEDLEAADLVGAPGSGQGLFSFDAVDDINIVAIPDLTFRYGEGARDAQLAAMTYCQNRQDCFFIADSPNRLSPQQVLAYKQGRGAFSGNAFNSTFGALYYPWIYVTDPLSGKRKLFPPSGAMAGTYSATDVRRGVHKAPAGTEDGYLSVAVDIERVTSKGEQDTLNPEGVNVIRKFPDAGIVAWGTRTVSADPEWKYVPVRRLFLFLEESIEEGTQWVVFEPNDRVLWKRIVRNVSNFLRIQWSEGKLVGATPEEAFFVKCDEETNPPESVDLGRVITLIGVAPSKPAEFVIFRIFQSRAGSGVEEL